MDHASSGNGVRILLIKEGENWFAQVLELNVSAQMRSYKEVGIRLAEALEAVITTYADQGMDWRKHLPPTPARYEQMYKDAVPFGLMVDDELRQALCPDAKYAKVEIEFKVTERELDGRQFATSGR